MRGAAPRRRGHGKVLITHADLKKVASDVRRRRMARRRHGRAGSGGGAARDYDAETQTIIRSLAAPLLKAAELDPAGIDIVVILDPSINAFVAGGPYIFINTGLILATTEVGQLMGVLAHEIGHLRGGDVLRTRNIAGLASKAAVSR